MTSLQTQRPKFNDIVANLTDGNNIKFNEVMNKFIDDLITRLDAASNDYFAIWAEENAALGASNTYEWAFGNGANTPSTGGVTIYVPSGYQCHAVAMSLRVGGGTATVELVHNGTPQGSDARVVLSTGQSATEEFTTPLEISDGDYINFRTSSSSGTAAPNVVTAWLRMSVV